MPTAERLYGEASELDANQRSVRSIGIEISEVKRQSFVGECLTEARSLLAIGNVAAAVERIRDGRQKYPKDLRLKQFENSLLKDSPELQVRQEQIKRLEHLEAARQRLEHDPDAEKAKKVLELAREVGARNPQAPETLRSIEAAEQTIRRVMGIDDLSSLLRPETDVARKGTGPSVGLKDEDDKTRIYTPSLDTPVKTKESTKPPRPPIAGRVKILWQKVQSRLPAMDAKTRVIAIGVLGSIVVLVFAGVLLHRFLYQNSKKDDRPALAPTKIHIAVIPADSVLKVNGIVNAAGDISIPEGTTLKVGISRLGYESRVITLDHDARNQTVELAPLPIRISVAEAENSGAVELDGINAGSLTDGSIEGLDVTADSKGHTIAVVAGGKRVARLEFQAMPGQRPRVSSINLPAKSNGVIIVSSLGSAATVYGGKNLKNAQIDGVPVSLSNDGLDVPQTSNPSHVLTYNDGGETATLSLDGTEWPSISLRSLGATAELEITSDVDTATLTADGTVVPHHRHGWRIKQPGTYHFVLSADPYETQTWMTTLKPKQALRENHPMVPHKEVQPVLAALVISEGTPGAQVELDGAPLGELDGEGSRRFEARLSSGTHQVVFQKDGLCGTRTAEIVAAPPAEAHMEAPKLDPCASITLQATAQPTSVKVLRSGDPNAKWIVLTPGKKTPLAAGTYQVAVEATGNSYATGIKLEAGHNFDFKPIETAMQHCQLQNPGEAAVQGDWMKAKNSGSLVYLSAGCVNVNLLFGKLKNGFLVKKRIEWTIEVAGGAGRVAWEFDGEKISRKSIVQQQTIDPREANIQSLMNGNPKSYDIRIRVDGQHIRIINENGATLDDYTPQNPTLNDLAGGRVGIKTSGEFKFSGSGN